MMNDEINFFEFLNPWNGKPMVGYFTIHKYWYNGRTCVKIRAKEKLPEEFFEPFCDVTVNLPNAELSSENLIFLDVNNAPWLEQFMIDNGFGMPTGRFRTSGFVNYPLYLCDMKKIHRYGKVQIPERRGDYL